MTTRSSKPVWLSIIVAFVFLAVLFSVVETVHPVFQLPEEFQNLPAEISSELLTKYLAASTQVTTWNTILIAAIAGGGLALAHTACGCCCRSTLGQGIAITLLGLVIGMSCGALGGWGGRYVRLNFVESVRDLGGLMFAHSIMLGLIGFGAGLARGVGIGTRKAVLMSAAGGLLGGVAAAIAYVLIISIALPGEKIEFLIADKTTIRMIWFALATILVSIAIVLSDRVGSRPNLPPPEPAGSEPV